MSFIDFHAHSSIKTFLSGESSKERRNAWENFDVSRFWNILGRILDSQSSLTQAKQGNVRININAISPIEKEVANTGLVSNGARLIRHIDRRFLNKIGSGRFPYFNLFLEELQHLIRAKSIDDYRKFNALNSIHDFNPDELNIIFCIEGGHALYNDVNFNGSLDQVLTNLHHLKNNDYRILYLTLCHMARNPLATHAFGVKLVDTYNFIPQKTGISHEGKEVIKKALNRDSGSRILIDLKHMSLKSRLQYLDMISQSAYSDVPPVYSHVAATGFSYKEMPVKSIWEENGTYRVRYKKPEGLMNRAFNPSSINLYDEEIQEVVKKGGMIGLIMDKRVLGVGRIHDEIFSAEEFREFSRQKISLKSLIQRPDDQGDQQDFIRKLRRRNGQTAEEHLNALCNNILHMVKVGGPETWKHLCIGSDFDGLIDAIEICQNSTYYEKLEKALIQRLPEMANTDPENNYHIHDINFQVRDLMFNNAWRFLEKYFN